MLTFLSIIKEKQLFIFVSPLVAHLQYIYTYFQTHNAPAFASV